MFWELPESLEVAGRTYDIDSDFRTALRVLAAYGNPDLSASEKALVCLANIYIDAASIPDAHLQEAYDAAVRFIDNGQEQEPEQSGHRSMDWEQDAALIFPAVNNVAGFEVRSTDYLHWYTFLGYFMEIKDSVFSTVMRLRQKKHKQQKLDKAESEFWRNNRKICELKVKLSAAEQAAYDRFDKLFS